MTKKNIFTSLPEAEVDEAPVQKKLYARTPEARRAERKARKLAKAAAKQAALPQEEQSPGVMYLGHIPHGFYEDQIRAFFAQFGEVTRVRVARSKKTARSKGFAYVEFAFESVAKVAAEAMDGYLMLGRALVARFVAADKLHEKALKGANREFKRMSFGGMEGKKLKVNGMKEATIEKRRKRLLRREEQRREKFKRMGISYKFPGFESTRESS